MFYNAKVALCACVCACVCVWERVFVSPVGAEGVTGLVSRIVTEAAACRSAASGHWTTQPIYSGLTTDRKTNQPTNHYLFFNEEPFISLKICVVLPERTGFTVCLKDFNLYGALAKWQQISSNTSLPDVPVFFFVKYKMF